MVAPTSTAARRSSSTHQSRRRHNGHDKTDADDPLDQLGLRAAGCRCGSFAVVPTTRPACGVRQSSRSPTQNPDERQDAEHRRLVRTKLFSDWSETTQTEATRVVRVLDLCGAEIGEGL